MKDGTAEKKTAAVEQTFSKGETLRVCVCVFQFSQVVVSVAHFERRLSTGKCQPSLSQIFIHIGQFCRFLHLMPMVHSFKVNLFVILPLPHRVVHRNASGSPFMPHTKEKSYF